MESLTKTLGCPALLLLALGLVGCSQGGCPGDEADSPDGSPLPLRADAGQVEPPPARAREVTLTDGAPLPLELGQARRGRLIATGGHMVVRAVSSDPPRALIGRAEEADGPVHSISLHDLDSGRQLAEVEHLNALCEEIGAARVTAGDPPSPALLRLDDGRLLRPQPRLPEGAGEAGAPLIVATASAATALVFADGPDGTHWYGEWRDLGQPVVSLDRQSPVAPRTFSWDETAGAFEVSDGAGTPARAGRRGHRCVRVRVPTRGAPLCRAWGQGDESARIDQEQSWLGDDWTTDSSSDYTMALNTRTGDRQWLAPPWCPARLSAALRSPPRVLVGCVHQHRGTYSIWRPGASVLFEVDLAQERSFHSSGTVAHSILPATSIAWSLESSSAWVDLVEGAVIETAPLRPLQRGSQERLTLADRREGEATLLLALDFDRREQLQLARYEDCPGALHTLARRGRRFAVACLTRPDEGLWVFQLHWSEVLDLDRRRRWRTNDLVEHLLEDGRVVASDRPGTAAESDRTARNVFFLDLPE